MTEILTVGSSLFPFVLIVLFVLHRLREVSDVAVMQASALQARQHSKDKELEALRRQLLDYQVPGCSFLGLFNLGRSSTPCPLNNAAITETIHQNSPDLVVVSYAHQ